MVLRDEHIPMDDPSREAEPGSRLNLLLSYGGWREESMVDQLPRLLNPMGIRSYRAETGEEAEEIIRTYQVHIAVVDLTIPLKKSDQQLPTSSRVSPGGFRMLQILRRLEQPPPTIVIRPPDPSARQRARMLAESLREGAFAVLDRPVAIEHILDVLRRVLRRHYADVWPE